MSHGKMCDVAQKMRTPPTKKCKQGLVPFLADVDDDRKLPAIIMLLSPHHPPMPPPLPQQFLIAVAHTFGPQPPQFSGRHGKRESC
jgi:hypothetical protein